MDEDQLKDAISWFRASIRHQAELSPSPGFQGILAREQVNRRPLRWVAAAVLAILILGAIPIERNREQQRATEQAREDALLLEKVNAGISRTVPRSMEPLLGLGETR